MNKAIVCVLAVVVSGCTGLKKAQKEDAARLKAEAELMAKSEYKKGYDAGMFEGKKSAYADQLGNFLTANWTELGPFERVYFEFDKSTIPSESTASVESIIAEIRKLKDILLKRNKALTGLEVRIVGHADERGPSGYNLALAARRAQTLQSVLSAEFPSLPISIESQGEEFPVCHARTKDCWKANRSAIVQIRYRE